MQSQELPKGILGVRKAYALRGWVYFLDSGLGYHKIGRTTDLRVNLTRYSSSLPTEPFYIHYIETENTRELESLMHKRFAHKRVRNEWYCLSSEDIEYIKGLK